MLQSFFSAISTLINLYSLVCLARVLMSWVPDFEYSAPGRFIAGLCDPYLNWFRRFRFTRVGAVDFSPILALGALSVASMTFTTIGATGRFSLGVVLYGILQVLWSFFSFFFNILILFLAIRLIYDLVNRHGYSPFWSMMDRFLNPPIAWVTGALNRGRSMPYRTSLIITLVATIAGRVLLSYAVSFVGRVLANLPV